VVVRTTRRELAYRWNAPRSPAARLALVPLFLVAVVLLVLLGALAVALMLVLSVVALIALTVVGRVSPRRPKTRRTTIQVTRRRP
jgi:uncharacterized membrane protein YgcG